MTRVIHHENAPTKKTDDFEKQWIWCIQSNNIAGLRTLLQNFFEKHNIYLSESVKNERSQLDDTIKAPTPHTAQTRNESTVLDSIHLNARDEFGRTALHVSASCSSSQRNDAVHVVQKLLSLIDYSDVKLNKFSSNGKSTKQHLHGKRDDVNLQDLENRWTALHRSVYNGNQVIAQMLWSCLHISATLIRYLMYLIPP
jgi:hypothetical protein